MLTSSSSPNLNSSASSKYSPTNPRSFSRQATINTNRVATSPRASPQSALVRAGSLSPSLNRFRAPAPGFRSPKRPTADAGTQYTPLGSPPTASTTKLHAAAPFSPKRPEIHSRATIASNETAQAPHPERDVAPEPPTEPQVRESPIVAPRAVSLGNNGKISPSLPSSSRSSVKRQKQSGAEVKILPGDYAQCEPKILATLMSELLMDLVNHNDHIKLEDDNLTRFHSRTPPGISVHDYLHRLTFHATIPSPVLLAMVYYIDKLCEAYPAFTINSLTVHRFLIAAATVAAKGLCDVFWTNSTYAKVGGVSKKELALLELELLTKIEWRIVPNPDKLGDYYRSVVEGHPDYSFEESDSSRTTSSESLGTDTLEME